jgi:hypothetical protein
MDFLFQHLQLFERLQAWCFVVLRCSSSDCRPSHEVVFERDVTIIGPLSVATP